MKKASKTRLVFKQILEGIEATVDAAMRPNWRIEYDYEELMAIKNAWERRERQQAVRRLRQQRLIRARKQGQRIFLELTVKGRGEALKQLILESQKLLPPGKICLVSFDVPESVRAVRVMLRDFLVQAGFKLIHKSVWFGRRDVVLELRQLIKKMKAEKWIKVFKAEEN